MDTTELQCPPLGDWLHKAPWRDRAVSLIHVSPTTTVQAHTLHDKRIVVDHLGDGVLLAAWTGKWRTDVRAVSADDLGAVRDAIA